MRARQQQILRAQHCASENTPHSLAAAAKASGRSHTNPGADRMLLRVVVLACTVYRHLAAAEGCYSVAAWLLEECGVASNPVDRFKRTPLEVRFCAQRFFPADRHQAHKQQQAEPRAAAPAGAASCSRQ